MQIKILRALPHWDSIKKKVKKSLSEATMPPAVLAEVSAVAKKAAAPCAVTTVLQAVKSIKNAHPELGAKKFLAQVKVDFPELVASGVKVGAKEVREALAECSPRKPASADLVRELCSSMTTSWQLQRIQPAVNCRPRSVSSQVPSSVNGVR